MANQAVIAGAAGALVFVLLVSASLTGIAPTNLLSVVPSLPTPIQHVIVTVFENQAYGTVMGNSVFKSEADTYAYASAFYAECHPSAGNYVTTFFDNPQGICGSDSVRTLTAPSLANELDAKGVSWAFYEGNMPTNCYKTDDGAVYYWAHHDPAVYSSFVTSSASYCDSHVLTMGSSLSPSSWNSSAPPAFAWVQQGKGVYGLSTAAAFLQYDLSLWQTKSWWSSTVVLALFDESVTGDTACPGVDGLTGSSCGGHTYLAAIGPYDAGVGAYTAPSDHYSVYATVVWLLGLTPFSPYVGTPMKGLFSFGGGGGSGSLSVSLSASPSSVIVGSAVTLSSTVSGGTAPYVYAWSNPGAGAGCGTGDVATLSCAPRSAGTYKVTVTATDAAGRTGSASATFSATAPTSNLSLSALVVSGAAVVGGSYSISAYPSGGTPPYAYSWSGLPPGCSTGSSQKSACTTDVAGEWNVTLTVTDSTGGTASSSALVTVAPSAPPPAAGGSSSFHLTEADLVSIGFAGVAGIGVAMLVLRRLGWGALALLAGAAGYFAL